MRTLLLLYLWRYTIDYTRSRERMRKRGTFNYSFFFLIGYHSQLKQSCFWIIWAPTNFHHNNHHFSCSTITFSFVFTRAMQQVLVSQVTSTIIMKENHFTKGEKKRQGTSINDAVLLVKKPEFDPKVPNWLFSLCEHLTNWLLQCSPIICHLWMPRPNFT